MNVRVIVAERRTLVREGFVKLLQCESGIDVVGSTDSGYETLRLAKEKNPNVALLSHDLIALDGVATTRLITQEQPALKVIMLPVYDECDEDVIVDAVKSGARGYINDDADGRMLVTQVRRILSNGTALTEEITSRLLDRLARGPEEFNNTSDELDFTEREKDVLELICHGISNKQIGAALYLSENTVRSHVSNLIQKVEVENRTQLAIYGMRKGFGYKQLPEDETDPPAPHGQAAAGIISDSRVWDYTRSRNGASATNGKNGHNKKNGHNGHKQVLARVSAGSR